MSTRTITMSDAQIKALAKQLEKGEKRKTPPYAQFQIKTSDCIITAYTSGKVEFQGEGADFYACLLYTSPSPRDS